MLFFSPMLRCHPRRILALLQLLPACIGAQDPSPAMPRADYRYRVIGIRTEKL